jgi:hypothetical protein
MWNYDMAECPKGCFVTVTKKVGKNITSYQEWQRQVVILASKCGKVTTSEWLPETDKRKVGRWNMFSPGEEPLAWMPWPTHPTLEVNV